MSAPMELVDLELAEVSAVDVPANAGARVLMFKQINGLPGEGGTQGGGTGDGAGPSAPAPEPAEKGNTSMTDKTPAEALTKAQVDDMIAAAVAKATASTETLIAKARQETQDAAEVEIAKVRERAEAAEAAAAAERLARELATLAKRAADDFGLLPGTDGEKAVALKALEAVPEAARATLEKMLGAGQAALKGVTKPRGHQGATGGSTAHDEITAKARDLMAADASLTFAKAYDRASLENPALYSRYLAERPAASHS